MFLLFCAYDSIIKKYLEDGIVEIIETSGEEGMVHYLPHRAVIREDRDTSKIRPVFDASSKVGKEPSLNECLYAGPCLLPSIYDILLRFRMGRIGLVSDIQQAFLNIEIYPEHRDLLRFLWVEDIDVDAHEFVTYRFTRDTFGLTCGPFLLNGTVRTHLSKYLSTPIGDVVPRLQRDLYVDDSATSVDTVEEAIRFYEVSKEVMAQGGFKLRKWDTNNTELRSIINDETKTNDSLTYAKVELGDSKVYRKVLGVNWDIDSDSVIFVLKGFGVEGLKLPVTKRNILKVSASFFDPVGLICPVILQAKLFFKNICSIKSDWDALVTDEMARKWYEYLNDLRGSDDIRVSRFLFDECNASEKIESVELHGFADSSKDAGAAVVYIRYLFSSGATFSKLVTAKSKIASSKISSIPRLELISCVVLSKLICAVKAALLPVIQISNIICWADSEVALYWLKVQGKNGSRGSKIDYVLFEITFVLTVGDTCPPM